ncbi:MAG: SDR family oxidoreductase [Deltaproteobacteria bacterium]|jgi:3-oxoacyl-[acyl-carrier protein] reductase|nr:SDR family oxidoreductase [Deltaproteobacteria bacterium]
MVYLKAPQGIEGQQFNGGSQARRVAMVAGSTGALGRVSAEALAVSGCKIWCGWNKSGETASDLAEKIGGSSIRLSSDMSQDGLLDVFQTVYQTDGRLDIVVNASGLNVEGPAAGLDYQDWRLVFEVNLDFAFRLTQAAIRIMLPQAKGTVIHLSSSAAHLGGRGQLNYASSKAALERMVEGFAREVGRKGVTVNAVSPGLIASPMTARIARQYEDRILERISMGRLGKPEEVASVVSFLAGDGASYINGAVIAVDGGLW